MPKKIIDLVAVYSKKGPIGPFLIQVNWLELVFFSHVWEKNNVSNIR